ncbi:hypothetical protein SEA_BANTAM_168 [Gordonia phage Bantam]|uniref:Uncharacterized protein n=1 Tax=Gordonia phage Bantam TaxID=1887641 RepID=A0A1B3AYN6_9CAUD|nr:hypothetical protein BIZ77_gp011 [Gordonia phage Bantam]AOE43857.1 hypothetical protein SEA_BANTAM_168 [Gordonia phage Bantam]
MVHHRGSRVVHTGNPSHYLEVSIMAASTLDFALRASLAPTGGEIWVAYREAGWGWGQQHLTTREAMLIDLEMRDDEETTVSVEVFEDDVLDGRDEVFVSIDTPLSGTLEYRFMFDYA